MSISIRIIDNEAWVSKKKLDSAGIGTGQILSSLGVLQGKVIKLVDVDTGVEIKV